ncbi:hypothetical protein BV898_16466 [Hypsibius exemplaris]|uniref:Metallo-beta-lactamase domain-containing protein n=1 Tax=Hypsibius exemplaris TaxID=2072580 RepID=A0A9X6RLI3_HYPEX|nr:hypothetical protein BV898_16466 [Hypsibius exemplaris]
MSFAVAMFSLMVLLTTHLPGCLPAAVPQVKTPGPGFFRLMLGDFEVTAISDGTGAFPPEALMPNAPKEELLRARQRAFVPTPAPMSCNAFLVNTKEHLVLIDTGAGSLMGPSFGKLVENIRAAGYQPEQIDNVLLTHLHPDHVGGVTSSTNNHEIRFPNAVIRTSQAELDFWLNPARQANASGHLKKTFGQAQAALAPYQALDRLKTFNATEKEILPGFRVVIRAGHSPGHTQFFVESGGRTMVAWGDITHFEWVQLANPALTIAFDFNQPETAKDRLELLEVVVEKKLMVAAAHFAFPGLGYLRRVAGQGYDWVPVRYDSEPTRVTTADFLAEKNATTSN